MAIFEIIAWVLTAVLVGVTQNTNFIYVPFLISCVNNMVKFCRERKFVYLLIILLLSVMVPGNYVVYAPIIVMFLYLLKKKIKLSKGEKIFGIALLILVVVSSLANQFLAINKMFSVLFFLPAVLLYPMAKKSISMKEYDVLRAFLKWAIVLQLIFVAATGILNFQKVSSAADFDWVSGSFGAIQGNMFFFFMAFCAVFFLNDAINMGNKKSFLLFTIATVLLIMTGSISLILAYFGALLFVFAINISKKNSKVFVIVAVAMVAFFVLVTPQWVGRHMANIVSAPTDYIGKLSSYKNAFVDLWSNDPTKVLTGVGVGQYSSRAALTCTGVYVDKYSDVFEVSMSEYTRKYVYNDLKYQEENRGSVLDTPQSEVISIESELGIVGLVLLCIFCGYLVKKTQGYYKIYSILFVLACFIENYLEFAKVVIPLYLVMLLSNSVAKKIKRESEK